MQNSGLRLLVLGAALSGAAAASWAVEYPRLSPRGTASQLVGYTEVAIAYGRPRVREREIWGGLVPYNKLWRTGADEVTAIAFSQDVTVEGNKVPAGVYSLFTIPGKTEWTIILNRNAKVGAFQYKESEDLLRFKVKPQPAELHERLTFAFPVVTLDSAELALCWERLKVAFTIKTDAVNVALSQARAAVAEAKPDDYRTPLTAAIFCLDNDLNLDEAGVWIERSIAIKENMSTLVARARLFAAKGKKTEAVAAALRAIEVGQVANPNANMSWVESYIAEWRK